MMGQSQSSQLAPLTMLSTEMVLQDEYHSVPLRSQLAPLTRMVHSDLQ